MCKGVAGQGWQSLAPTALSREKGKPKWHKEGPIALQSRAQGLGTFSNYGFPVLSAAWVESLSVSSIAGPSSTDRPA